MPETTHLFAPKTVAVEDVFNSEPYKMTVCVYPHPQTLYFSNLIRRPSENIGGIV